MRFIEKQFQDEITCLNDYLKIEKNLPRLIRSYCKNHTFCLFQEYLKISPFVVYLANKKPHENPICRLKLTQSSLFYN